MRHQASECKACSLRREVRRPAAVSSVIRLTLQISGTVQGVGFRPFVFGLATSLRLAGSVRNAGTCVVCVVEGPRSACDEFVRRVSAEAPVLADVHTVDIETDSPQGERGFRIAESRSVDIERLSSIPPDIATCASCQAEVADPTNRRHRFPFVACTACGPRYSVVRKLPYDRAGTSMAEFPLCAACQSEFDDPRDRRFHAQATSCPDCGPTLTASIDDAVVVLSSGGIVAVKGLGGYQLLCRADVSAPVRRLRERKHREAKPFALLVESVEAAERIAELDDDERRALQDPAAPIVLIRALAESPVAAEVAPTTELLGVMLPATSLHAMLAGDVGVPLVCTSGNRSNEPIIVEDDVAMAAFADIADLVLSHDRRIERRADDSVGHVVGGEFRLLRRARGYAPKSIPLDYSGPTVLGVGAELKSTTCLAIDDRASLSVHLGDLENPQTFASFEATIADQLGFAEADLGLVVHDLHPEYLSTKFATAQHLAPTLGVQHHHAHLVSCLVEHGHAGPAIGVVFDGLGWGEDGTAWGGEFLVGDATGYDRAAFLEPVAMPGGARAIREPARMAVAHCLAAFDEVPTDVADELNIADLAMLAAVASNPITLRTSSVGRLFDAVAALCGMAGPVRYEGEAAIALEGLAAAWPHDVDPYEWTSGSARELIRSIVADRRKGIDRRLIARRFHRSVAAFVETTCRRIRADVGISTVALSGGVFQNRLLVEMVVPTLEEAGCTVLQHRHVPPNDGGISLGQVAIGRAHLVRSQ